MSQSSANKTCFFQAYKTRQNKKKQNQIIATINIYIQNSMSITLERKILNNNKIEKIELKRMKTKKKVFTPSEKTLDQSMFIG